MIPTLVMFALLAGAVAWLYVRFRRSVSQAEGSARKIWASLSKLEDELRTELQDQVSDILEQHVAFDAAQRHLESRDKGARIEFDALKVELEEVRARTEAIETRLVAVLGNLEERTMSSLQEQSAALRRLEEDLKAIIAKVEERDREAIGHPEESLAEDPRAG